MTVELAPHVIVGAIAHDSQWSLMYAHIPALSCYDPCALIESLITESLPLHDVSASVVATYMIQYRIGLESPVHSVAGINHSVQAHGMGFNESKDALVQGSAFG